MKRALVTKEVKTEMIGKGCIASLVWIQFKPPHTSCTLLGVQCVCCWTNSNLPLHIAKIPKITLIPNISQIFLSVSYKCSCITIRHLTWKQTLYTGRLFMYADFYYEILAKCTQMKTNNYPDCSLLLFLFITSYLICSTHNRISRISNSQHDIRKFHIPTKVFVY